MGNAGMSPTDQTGGITGITAHVGGKALTVSDEEKSIIANAKLESGELAKLLVDLVAALGGEMAAAI